MDRKVKFYWAERLMFNIKDNLKAFYSVDYYNEILSMSVLIILSPSTAFRKLANENVIGFFPFCVGYSGMLSNFWNMKQLFLSDFRQRIFSSSKMSSPLRQIFKTLVIKIRILPLNDWSCLRYFTNIYIVCVSTQCNENNWNKITLFLHPRCH